MKFDWRKIWREFGQWCDSQEQYPWEWWQQEPQLQAIIKKYRLKKMRTAWQRVWGIYAAMYEEDGFVSWERQKRWIQRLIVENTRRIK